MFFFPPIQENKFGPGKWILVGDCKGSTLLHSRELTPVLVKEGLEMMRNALPIRVQNVHLLNVPPYMEFIFNFAKAVAKKKVSERVGFSREKIKTISLF